jgi:aromatic-amino-acid transaminase
MFENIPAYLGDPILSLNEDFQRDARPNKVNLSIGIYFDDAGKLPMMSAVSESEADLHNVSAPRPYLSMAGHTQYREMTQKLIFGENCTALAANCIATLQTIGGSGALKVGADFLKRYFPASQVWLSDPSWENHRVVFEGAGFSVNTYPYYDSQTGGLRFEDMLDTIDRLPAQSIVLLHACCHNPTGVDLGLQQWAQLIAILAKRELIAFVDMAYQGFGDGLNDDAQSVRMLAAANVPLIVATSYSKSFSLYGERCGSLSAMCTSSQEAERVQGQLMSAVRANYSNPPTHGAKLIAGVLSSKHLRQSWEQELEVMRKRIIAMRTAIHDQLVGRIDDKMCARYLAQRGMFTYTGLSASQVARLRHEHAVYLLVSGRMCVAGLNTKNVSYVADAILEVLTA